MALMNRSETIETPRKLYNIPLRYNTALTLQSHVLSFKIGRNNPNSEHGSSWPQNCTVSFLKQICDCSLYHWNCETASSETIIFSGVSFPPSVKYIGLSSIDNSGLPVPPCFRIEVHEHIFVLTIETLLWYLLIILPYLLSSHYIYLSVCHHPSISPFSMSPLLCLAPLVTYSQVYHPIPSFHPSSNFMLNYSVFFSF